MKSSDDWEDYYRRIDRALPKYKPMPLFDKLEQEIGPLAEVEEIPLNPPDAIEGTATETKPE